ncbi:MAG: thiamine diphosphokinase [Fimbriimonadaceae bacterium]|nr:thiamine diphosphokinase [Fimbriimonadaceae bacterium]QYK56154.1 MAG: thiamine diphosphokinase [Fimbriimonadaceae bacterium]
MQRRVLGVLGGGETPEPMLRAWTESADVVYAADSGANRLIRMGFTPHVIGDLDSFDPSLHSPDIRVVQDGDQHRTDCDKLLDLAMAEGATALTLIEAEGDLLDHVMATLSSLGRSALRGRIVLRRAIAWKLAPGDQVAVPAVPGGRVSLIPLVASTGISLSGVRWPVEDAAMEPAGFLSISNEATADRVVASLGAGLAYLFVEAPTPAEPAW